MADWTEDQIVKLDLLLRENVSVKEIAKALGVSDDAVRSKLRRQQKEAAERDRGRCKWPIGDPMRDDFRWCPEKAIIGKPYCAEHMAIGYTGLGTKMQRSKILA